MKTRSMTVWVKRDGMNVWADETFVDLRGPWHDSTADLGPDTWDEIDAALCDYDDETHPEAFQVHGETWRVDVARLIPGKVTP